MRLIPDEDQEELRRVVRSFLTRFCSEDDVRRQMSTERGWDESAWRRATEELGLAGLEIPEEFGGAGAGFAEVAIVLQETGRSLACLPYFSTVVLGAGVLLLGDDDQARKDLLPALADGSRTATLALAGESGAWDATAPSVTAACDDNSWRLDGVTSFVVDGLSADLILVAARTAGEAGPSVFAVDGDAAGLARRALATLDPTRKLAHLEFSGAPARLLGREGAAGSLLDRVLDRALTGLACEQVGGAEATLDAAVAYAKQRLQFGRPIGSFQAIKHKCADMLQHVEAARVAAAWALATLVEGSDDAPAAAMAAVRCSDAFRYTAGESIQVHGGSGFTWEHPAHLYFRRAASSAELFGSPAAHRERLLQRIGV